MSTHSFGSLGSSKSRNQWFSGTWESLMDATGPTKKTGVPWCSQFPCARQRQMSGSQDRPVARVMCSITPRSCPNSGRRVKISQATNGYQWIPMDTNGYQWGSNRGIPTAPRNWMFDHLPCDHQALRCPHFGRLHLSSWPDWNFGK